jgi:single-stranded-DNA-specific exonuclease
MPEVVARVMALRGVRDTESGRRWLDASLRDLPDPKGLTAMDAAVDRVLAAIERQELICIHGDYDVDGMTSTALLVQFLQQLGAKVMWFAPHRARDGYGVQAATMRRLAASGVKLVVTCDNGVSAHDAIDEGNRLGIDTVVVDHHTIPPTLPLAAAILNPKRDGDGNPYEELAAVGVAFLLAVAIRGRLREQGAFQREPEPDLREALDLVALGTVADLAPLRGLNRMLVRAGIRVMERRKRPGLRALLEVSGIGADRAIDAFHLGFQLGPRLNAAGRVDDAALALDLLLTDDPGRAEPRARELDQMNRRRQEIEAEMLKEALAQVAEAGVPAGPGGIVLWSERWHAGVVGIVAAKVCQEFHRPALVIAIEGDRGTGSGRGIGGVDLFAAVGRCQDLLLRWGGHRAAAGLSVMRDQLPALRERFAGEAFAGQAGDHWEPTLLLDAELGVERVDWDLWESLARLRPFGLGNAEPVFLGRGLRVTGVRKVAKGGLKMSLRGGDAEPKEAIGFGLSIDADAIPREVDAAFCVAENHWAGRRTLELRLRDIRPAEPA